MSFRLDPIPGRLIYSEGDSHYEVQCYEFDANAQIKSGCYQVGCELTQYPCQETVAIADDEYKEFEASEMVEWDWDAWINAITTDDYIDCFSGL